MRLLDGQPKALAEEIYSARLALGAGPDGLDLLYVMREVGGHINHQSITLPELYKLLDIQEFMQRRRKNNNQQERQE